MGGRPAQGRAWHLGADEEDSPRRFLHPRLSRSNQPFPYRLKVENHEGHAWDFVDPYMFGPIALRLRPAPPCRGNALSQLRAAWRPHQGASRVPGRPFRRLGPQCRAGQRDRQFQSLGRPAARDGQPRCFRHLGGLHPGSVRGRSLQVRSEEPARRLPGREVRSLWIRCGAAARRRRRSSGTS